MPTIQNQPRKKSFPYTLRGQILGSFLFLLACALALITAISLFGIPGTQFPGIIKETERGSFAALNLVADLKKERLGQWMRERRSDMQLVAKNPLVADLLHSHAKDIAASALSLEHQRNRQKLTNYLREIQNTHKIYEKIEIFDAITGRHLATTESTEHGVGLINFPMVVFQPGAEEQLSLVLENGTVNLMIYRRFTFDAGPDHESMPALVRATINADEFIRPILHTGEGLGKTGEVLLVTEDRQIVTSLKYPLSNGRRAELLSYQITAAPARFAAQGKQGFIAENDYRGVPVFAAYRHIPISTAFGLGMVVKINQEEVYAPLKKDITTLLAMIFIASVLIAIISLFLSRKLSLTVREMVGVAERVEAGNLESRIQETQNDELGGLARSLNRMIDRLQGWHAELDQQVKTRTADLQQTTLQLSQEIAEREVAEEEVRLQSEMMRRMAEGVYLIRMDGTIVYTNPKFEELFGYDPGEMIGKNASIVHFPSEKKPEETTGEILAVLEKDGFWQGELQNIKKDGTPFWCYASVIAFEHSIHGKVLVAVHNDITDRKRAEAEKSHLEARLSQAQKMEAIGTLAGGIAHDFNNILSIILGYAELAKGDTPAGSSLREDLEKILVAGNRATDLVKQILAFSRQAKVERIPLQLQSLVKESIKMLRASIPTTIEIQESIHSDCGVVLADPTNVYQIIMNLCTNAGHAMEKTGGVLTIALQNIVVEHESPPNAMALAPGRYVRLSVSDTGSGIGPDIIDKIFDPYFTTKEIGKGTGMGLAIAHGIITKYGGTITVDSKLGRGSTFHVNFPVAAQDTLSPDTEEEEVPSGAGRILMIDDEELLLQMGKDMMERLGYSVTIRNSSLDALATFQNNPDAFDVVITDQTMPGMTGSDLARRILQLRPDMPIILCTGYSNLIDENTAKFIGIREFALKPLTKSTIAHLLQKVLGRA